MRASAEDITSALERHGIATPASCGDSHLYAGDSRYVLRKIPANVIDCIVTSPPYATLKDYGSASQLGFGQASQAEYLDDLGGILRELHRIAKPGTAMWVVLDTVKSSGKTLLLPWETIGRAQAAGWQFEDLIIWDKGRSLPWSHIGRFRGVFEYVLLFSKGALERFSLNKAREIDHLSSYWVRYPERFNPAGKAATDLWHFPIPVQGSWSRNGIRHYCPFPVTMVGRMIALTTRPGDIVLDPFAGTGTVPAVASYLKRKGIGIEVNAGFVRTFARSGFKALQAIAVSELGSRTNEGRARNLSLLIIRLRILKAPCVLFGQLSRPDRMGRNARQAIAAFITTGNTSNKMDSPNGSVGHSTIYVVVRKSAAKGLLITHIAKVLKVPPLSKFGLAIEVKVVTETRFNKDFLSRLSPKRWYLYTNGSFHSYSQSLGIVPVASRLRETIDSDHSRMPPVLSPLRADVARPTVG